MKSIIIRLFALFGIQAVFLCLASAELGPNWRSKSLEMSANLRKNPTKENIIALGGRLVGVRQYNGGSLEEAEVIEEIVETITSVPGHAQYFADEIRIEQKAVEKYPTIVGPRCDYDRHRAWHFQTLSNLPSPETIKVLGEFLSDDKDTPVPLVSPDSDWGPNPPANSWQAAGTIMFIGLREPPVEYEIGVETKDGTLAKTRAWWEEIKAGKRTFSFKGQKVEYHFNPDGTWETIAMVNPPDDAPGRPEAAVSRPERRLAEQTNENGKSQIGKSLPWLLLASVILLGGAFWWAMRGAHGRKR